MMPYISTKITIYIILYSLLLDPWAFLNKFQAQNAKGKHCLVPI